MNDKSFTKPEMAKEEARREHKLAVGRVLSGRTNAVLLQSQLIDENDWCYEHIILCVTDGGFQPFVVWRFIVGVQQLASGRYGVMLPYCLNGSYHRDLADAIKDYDQTVDRMQRLVAVTDLGPA